MRCFAAADPLRRERQHRQHRLAALFGIGIQPTEVVKLTFIVVLAKQISYLKEYHDLNSVWSVAQLAVHFVLLFGLILFVSSDLGSALIFFPSSS